MSEEQQDPPRDSLFDQVRQLASENAALKQEIRSAHDMLDAVCRQDEGLAGTVSGETPNINLAARLFRYALKRERCPYGDKR